jgi:hypothetical protein
MSGVNATGRRVAESRETLALDKGQRPISPGRLFAFALFDVDDFRRPTRSVIQQQTYHSPVWLILAAQQFASFRYQRT